MEIHRKMGKTMNIMMNNYNWLVVWNMSLIFPFHIWDNGWLMDGIDV